MLLAGGKIAAAAIARPRAAIRDLLEARTLRPRARSSAVRRSKAAAMFSQRWPTAAIFIAASWAAS